MKYNGELCHDKLSQTGSLLEYKLLKILNQSKCRDANQWLYLEPVWHAIKGDIFMSLTFHEHYELFLKNIFQRMLEKTEIDTYMKQEEKLLILA